MNSSWQIGQFTDYRSTDARRYIYGPINLIESSYRDSSGENYTSDLVSLFDNLKKYSVTLK